MLPGTTDRRRRVATLLAGTGLAITLGLAGPAPATAAAAAVTTTDPAQAGAGWLASQLVDGERFEVASEFGVFADQGLTIDGVLAFAAAGAAGDPAQAALAWLATPESLDTYLGAAFDLAAANAYAKLVYAVQVYGLDPAVFGGLDVEAGLRALQAPSGRFVDDSEFDDFSNAFGQAFAILGLDRTAGGVPPSAVTYLAGQQCPDGGFPLQLEQATCESNVDATGMVVQALLVAGETGPATVALDWLEAVQEPDGGFGGSPPTEDINANSTGLAALALRVGGRAAAADLAVEFLTGLQVGCENPAEQRGAVAYDGSGFDPATAVRSTTQAVLGLAGVPLSELDGTGAGAAAPALACEAEPSPSPAPSPSPSPSPAPAPGGTGGEQLPVTGSPVVTMVGAGVLLVGAGGVAVWAARWRRRGPAPGAAPDRPAQG